MRHLGSIGTSAMLSTGPDTRTDDQVLAATVQRYVRRETTPCLEAIEHWGKRTDGRLEVLTEMQRDDAQRLDARLTRIDADNAATHAKEAILHDEILTLQRHIAQLHASLLTMHEETMTSRWRHLKARIRKWWERDA